MSTIRFEDNWKAGDPSIIRELSARVNGSMIVMRGECPPKLPPDMGYRDRDFCYGPVSLTFERAGVSVRLSHDESRALDQLYKMWKDELKTNQMREYAK